MSPAHPTGADGSLGVLTTFEPRPGPRSPLDALRGLALNHVAAWQPLHGRWRTSLLRRSGMVIGERVTISSHCFWGGSDVVIGDDTYVNAGCAFDTSGAIRIGARVALAQGVNIITGSHEIGTLEPGRRTGRAGANRAAPVVIGDDCWIGSRASILPGVTVAEGCVIGAGAVVTRSTLPHGIYAGVPARRLRDLPPRVEGTRADRTPDDQPARRQ